MVAKRRKILKQFLGGEYEHYIPVYLLCLLITDNLCLLIWSLISCSLSFTYSTCWSVTTNTVLIKSILLVRRAIRYFMCAVPDSTKTTRPVLVRLLLVSLTTQEKDPTNCYGPLISNSKIKKKPFYSLRMMFSVLWANSVKKQSVNEVKRCPKRNPCAKANFKAGVTFHQKNLLNHCCRHECLHHTVVTALSDASDVMKTHSTYNISHQLHASPILSICFSHFCSVLVCSFLRRTLHWVLCI